MRNGTLASVLSLATPWPASRPDMGRPDTAEAKSACPVDAAGEVIAGGEVEAEAASRSAEMSVSRSSSLGLCLRAGQVFDGDLSIPLLVESPLTGRSGTVALGLQFSGKDGNGGGAGFERLDITTASRMGS